MAANKKRGLFFLVLLLGAGGYTYFVYDSAKKTSFEIREISFFNVNLETNVAILTITLYANTTGYIPFTISDGEYNVYIDNLFLRKGTFGDFPIDQDGETYQASISLDDDYISAEAKIPFLALLAGTDQIFTIELVSAKFTVLTLPIIYSQNIFVAGYNP
jgi:hypothetical protein